MNSGGWDSYKFANQVIPSGSSRLIELPLMRLYTHTEISLPVKVLVGKRPGPTVFLSAAIHGDEVNGIEIIRRFLKLKNISRLRGVIIAVPVVNIHGLLHSSRYLPDRRDLNRVFPGSEKGSIASRVANLFMRSIVSVSDYGIDFHSGSHRRSNLPHIRAHLSDPRTKALALAFGAPVILDSTLRDGSLRAAMSELGKPILLFEGGEALRFDEMVIRAGLGGLIAVLKKVGSLPNPKPRKEKLQVFVAHSSRWIRAPQSGLFGSFVELGEKVKKGAVLGTISDPFGETETPVVASTTGVIIGRSNLPLANQGEALFHVARFEKPMRVEKTVEEYRLLFESEGDEGS